MEESDLVALARLRAETIARSTRSGPLLVVDDFLPATERDAVFEALVRREREFAPNTTDGRDGMVLRSFAESAFVTDAIRARFDEFVAALAALGAPVDDVTRCELEDATATASGHGSFHAAHIDNDPFGGVPAGVSRRISFAWHAFREPKRFEGGDLRVWDHAEIPSPRGPWTPGASSRIHTCADNALIVFSSYSLHEVVTVRAHGGAFADRRFAVVTAAHAG